MGLPEALDDFSFLSVVTKYCISSLFPVLLLSAKMPTTKFDAQYTLKILITFII